MVKAYQESIVPIRQTKKYYDTNWILPLAWHQG